MKRKDTGKRIYEGKKEDEIGKAIWPIGIPRTNYLVYFGAKKNWVQKSAIVERWQNWHGYSRPVKNTTYSIFLTVKKIAVIDDIVSMRKIKGTTELHFDEIFTGKNTMKTKTYDKYGDRIDYFNPYKTSKVWIAEKNGMAYHANTAKSAIKGLEKKIEISKEDKNYAMKLKHFSENTKITEKNYAKITGACPRGITIYSRRYHLGKISTVRDILSTGNTFYGREKLISLLPAAQ